MHTDLIHTIYLMAVSMNESQEDLGVWIKVPDGKLISIAPLLDLFETLNKAEFQDMVDNLEEIRQVLSNYLNESNVWEYKKCTETVGYLHEMMERLNHIVQKR